MPIIQPEGLKGLKGIGSLSKEEYDAFVSNNAHKIAAHNNDPAFIANLYRNKQYIDTFGIDAFRANPDFEARNREYRDKVVNDAFEEVYSPFEGLKRNNSKGLGANWEKYAEMPTDYKLKVLESGYLSDPEFENEWDKRQEQIKKSEGFFGGRKNMEAMFLLGTPLFRSIAYGTGKNRVESTGSTYADILSEAGNEEAAKEWVKTKNDRVLDNIYEDASLAKAKELDNIVNKAYYDQRITGHSDEATEQMFKEAITPGSYMGNLGIPEYAAYYRDGNPSPEMKDFTIDDMRQVLAKKAVYDSYMSPEMAATALGNEAKQYLHDHQGFLRRSTLFGKDVLISAASYTADKINGIYNIALYAQDKLGNKPVVMVDDRGNILSKDDPRLLFATENQALFDENGTIDSGIAYRDNSGQLHAVHPVEIDRTTLHNMGKNLDGSDAKEGFFSLNPQYWTRAEQFGTWDADEQKQWEKLGASPYKVAYKPGKDTDLAYEAFKMMSFGLADMASVAIPFGIGVAGRAIQASGKAGKALTSMGKAMDFTGKVLGTETKFGQVAQGLAGAGGIAYAYQRGAFQESLAENLAGAEESAYNASMNDILGRYEQDEAFRNSADALIKARTDELFNAYMKEAQERGAYVLDIKAVREELEDGARREVLGHLVSDEYNRRKNSKEYSELQERAIHSAGTAAVNTFFPEAAKYAIVNTVGFRKYLFRNPNSVAQKAARNFEGLSEKTLENGNRRMVASPTQFATRGAKLKELGKITASQIWGGAWTNGTDDMQVDAAERINKDSFDRYLRAYENGESIADVYGFVDGLRSYWNGLRGSLGQETTLNAAAVGGLGSALSTNLNFANITHLASKEGREAFRQNYMQRNKRNEEGMIIRDEQGKPIMEDIPLRENWRDRAAFFVQNGILSTYYGKKQAERDLQSHADYVNNILDDNDDFNALVNLIASDIGTDNAQNIGDSKTRRFIEAFSIMNALEHLGNNPKDPTTLSSVVQDRKSLIDKASRLGTEESDMTEEEISNLLSQYYSSNTVPQSEANDAQALQDIARNARTLKEAYEAYNKAEESIQNLEKEMGSPIVPSVRFRMKLSQALDSHWRERLQTMKDEVGDVSSDTPATGETLIAAVGGNARANSMIKNFGVYESSLIKGITDAISVQENALDEYNKVQQELRKAVEKGDSEQVVELQKRLQDAKDNYDEAIESRMYLEDNLSNVRENMQRIQEAVDEWEAGKKDRILSADEIMMLDPISRAKMLRELEVNPETGEVESDPYSKEQRKQIEKLKARLKGQAQNGDPLQKIQDIAVLTQQITKNEDAYHRISRHPDAAALQLERQKAEDAERAYQIVDERNARLIADYIDQMDRAVSDRKDVSEQDKKDLFYLTLRRYKPSILDKVAYLLPQYSEEINKAKEWSSVLDDIDAVMSSLSEAEGWSDATAAYVDELIDKADSKAGVMTFLDMGLDSAADPAVAKNIEDILKGLEELGYQRNAVVVENRKKRKEREEQQRKAEEERKKKLEEAVQEAVRKQAEEEAKKQEEEEKKKKGGEDGIDSTQPNPEDLLEGAEEVDLGDLGFEEDTPSDNNISSEPPTQQNDDSSVINNMEEVHDDVLGDVIQGKTPTPEEDVRQAAKEGLKDVQMTSDVSDSDEETKSIEDNNNISSTTLSGKTSGFVINKSSDNEARLKWARTHGVANPKLYDADLSTDHALVRKEGVKPDDNMSKYNSWMSSFVDKNGVRGINLDNITDDELPQLLEANSHLPIKFMRVRPDNNATHDDYMTTHLMLVVGYTSAVEKVHNNDNGGVVESDGKKYLIVGRVGYGRDGVNNEKKELYKMLMDIDPSKKDPNRHDIKTKAHQWFQKPEHKHERFYVHPDFHTEVMPDSMTPGWLVKRTETDSTEQYRSITELLADKQRNPHNLTIQNLAWGIQTLTGFPTVRIGKKRGRILMPNDMDDNKGRAFVLIPAGNGKLLAAKIEPLHYADGMNEDGMVVNPEVFNRDGSLWKKIQDALNRVISLNYDERIAAIGELSSLLYFPPEDRGNKNILISKKEYGDKVTVVDGNKKRTFTLNSDFNREDFFRAVREMNPRINVSLGALANEERLLELDEAGALRTDIAKLGTAGITYDIYGIDANGNMIIPDTMPGNRQGSSSNAASGSTREFVYLHGNMYKYNPDGGEYKYTKDGVPVKNDEMIDYARMIGTKEIGLTKKEGNWKYYIISSGESPVVVRQNNTYRIEKLIEEEAMKVIQEEEERLREKKRKQALEAAVETVPEEASDNAGSLVETEDGSFDFSEDVENSPSEKKVEETPALSQPAVQPVEYNAPKSSTRTFKQLWRSEDRGKLLDVIKQKGKEWADAPLGDMNELRKYLEKKGILNLDAIGTSEEDFNAWLQTIRCK